MHDQAGKSQPFPPPSDTPARIDDHAPDTRDEFFRCGPDLDVLTGLPSSGSPLERLAPPPFPRGKFPFMGFLATIYDHVSEHAARRGGRSNDPHAARNE